MDANDLKMVMDQIRIMFPKETCSDYYYATQKEWIDTNGVGGLASSTLIGANVRKYHGLLIAVTGEPARPYVLLSKLEENAVVRGKSYDLSTNQYPFIIFPEGHQNIERFEHDLYPRFIYDLGGVLLEKSVCMIQGENTVAVRYKVLRAMDTVLLNVRPLCAFREIDALTTENPDVDQTIDVAAHGFSMAPYPGLPALHVYVSAGKAEPKFFWYKNTEYRKEHERGLDFVEDLFSPAILTTTLEEGQEVDVVATIDDKRWQMLQQRGSQVLIQDEIDRRKSILADLPVAHSLGKSFALAADSFLVMPDTDAAQIVGGFHWACDPDLDQLVALTGLTLTTRKYETARRILARFARERLEPLGDGRPAPPTDITAALWFYVSMYHYGLYTEDLAFEKAQLYRGACAFLDRLLAARDENVVVDADHLIIVGAQGRPETWMNAVSGGRAVTPRIGKPVEVNALWYNTLCIMRHLAKIQDDPRGEALGTLAEQVKTSFQNAFWNDAGQGLYDVVHGGEKSDAIRPNQIFAIGLPFDVLDRAKRKMVLATVTKHLLTPFGLRTLSRADPQYVGHYAGDEAHRSRAYHQGTVWPWLMGQYVDAYLKMEDFSPMARDYCWKLIEHFREAPYDAGIGTVSEILDGEEPHFPKGRISDAKSVGEILRIIELLENLERFF